MMCNEYNKIYATLCLSNVAGEEEYMGSLNRSLSLVMDLFYRNIRSVGVSAATGQVCVCAYFCMVPE